MKHANIGEYMLTADANTITIRRRDGGPVVWYPNEVIEAAYALLSDTDRQGPSVPTKAAT